MLIYIDRLERRWKNVKKMLMAVNVILDLVVDGAHLFYPLLGGLDLVAQEVVIH